MNVGELREFLCKHPDDMPVILEKDAEGNGYSPLHDAREGMYITESTWSGWVCLTDEQITAS